MGSISIDITGRGYSMNEAFKKLCYEAEEETGRDAYSGGINNCVLRADISYMDSSKAVEYALNNAEKREVYGWCVKKPVENTNKTKTKVTRNPNIGTRIWKTYYVAREAFWNNAAGKVHAKSEKLAECISKAREIVEKRRNISLEITIEKELVKGETLCATVNYKKSSNQKPGVYRFIGYAPY
jgi:hypothetical protein